MSKKVEYDFGGIEELEFELVSEDEESNLLLRAYAAIPISTGEGAERASMVDPV